MYKIEEKEISQTFRSSSLWRTIGSTHYYIFNAFCNVLFLIASLYRLLIYLSRWCSFERGGAVIVVSAIVNCLFVVSNNCAIISVRIRSSDPEVLRIGKRKAMRKRARGKTRLIFVGEIAIVNFWQTFINYFQGEFRFFKTQTNRFNPS